MIETSGVIEKEQGNGFYLVTLEQPEGHQCLCRAAGKLTKFRIKLLAGDKVLVEISPYNLTLVFIIYFLLALFLEFPVLGPPPPAFLSR